MTIRTLKEIAKLPKFSKVRSGGVYRLTDRIYIDNVDGYGATKSHAQIQQRGFMNSVPLQKYLDVCCAKADEAEVASILHSINSGIGVACPRMYLDIDNYMSSSRGPCKIYDYEGHNIAQALLTLGVASMEIQFAMLGYGMNNIENVSDFYNCLNHNLVQANEQRISNILNLGVSA